MPLTQRAPHVLVIDGSSMILDLMRDLLEGEGLRVSTRTRVPADLDEIARLAPNLIVLDCLGPGQEDGWLLMQALVTGPRTAAIPVVLCTVAAHEVESHAQPLAAMGVAVVLKPFDIDDLLAVVWQTLEARGATARQTGQSPAAHQDLPRHERFSRCSPFVYARSPAHPRDPRTIEVTGDDRRHAGTTRLLAEGE